MIKRPRGRPPHSQKRKFETTHVATAHLPTRLPSSLITVYYPPTSQINLVAEPVKQITEVETDKPIKANVATKKVITALMLDSPATMVELTKSVPEVSKDLIQSVLDILQVLGIVVQYKSFEKSASLYTLAGFARGQAVDFAKIVEETKCKKEKTKAVRSRIDSFQEISEGQSFPWEKRKDLCGALDAFIAQDPELKDDALFRHLQDCIHDTGVPKYR